MKVSLEGSRIAESSVSPGMGMGDYERPRRENLFPLELFNTALPPLCSLLLLPCFPANDKDSHTTAPKYISTQLKSHGLGPTSKNPNIKQPNFCELLTLGSISCGLNRWEIMVLRAIRGWKRIHFQRLCILL